MCTAPGDDDGPRPAAAVNEEERTLRAADGATLREFVALPATGFRRGAVLIIHDIWGYTDFYKDLARRITANAHAAVLVDFFGRQGDLPESMRSPERTGSKPRERTPGCDASAQAAAQKSGRAIPRSAASPAVVGRRVSGRHAGGRPPLA